MKLDKILAQNVDTKIQKLLERNSKIQLEKLIGLINKTAPPDVVNTTWSNETDNCDSALKKMETNMEKLIIKKLETTEAGKTAPTELGNKTGKTYCTNKQDWRSRNCNQIVERDLRRCPQEVRNEAGKNQNTDQQGLFVR